MDEDKMVERIAYLLRCHEDTVDVFDRAYLDVLGKDPDEASGTECAVAKKEALCRLIGAGSSDVRTDSLNAWALRVVDLADRKGFRDDLGDLRGIDAMARYTTNLHREVSELWEAARAGELDALCDKAEKMRAAGIEPLTCAEEELADIIIRALDTAAVLGIDIDRAVRMKHAFNETRPHRHGGKLA